MPYSLDLRQKVINFIENGGTITEAAHTFGIGRASIYRWLSRPFGVNPTAIFYALKKMKITRKKNKFVIDKEVKEIEEKG